MKLVSSLFCFCLSSCLACILFISCEHKMSEEEVAAYQTAHKVWQKERMNLLKAPSGYINLAGLYIINKGLFTIGADSANNIVFPQKAPAFLGKLRVTNTNSVLYEAPETLAVKMRITGKDSTWEAAPMQLVHDDSMRVSLQMEYESLAWYIIKRGNNLAVRLRDYQHPKLDSVKSIEAYPFDMNWVFEAEFVPYKPAKALKIQNILGSTFDQLSPGKLVFERAGQVYALDVTEEGEEFFVTYADKTTGEATYGGGRYLYTSKPDAKGKVLLDFNKGYNPPCVYTPFATCPLPPAQNKLAVAILAGEKYRRPY